jgi:hypothetical protein
MTDNLATLLHHEVELGDKVRICSVLIEHIVLGASRTIDVPESFARKVLHLPKIFRSF